MANDIEFKATDFIPLIGLKQYCERNKIGYSDEYAPYGHPEANLEASPRATILQIYNLGLSLNLGFFTNTTFTSLNL